MSLSEKDIIIQELPKDELHARAPHAHFGWEGIGAFAFEVLADGYKKGAETIYDKMIQNTNDFALVDSVVYPLVFNWRQFVELFLKSIYFELSNKNDTDLKRFLISTGHDLNLIWKEVKPILSRGKKHVGASVSIGALEHYIKELNKFDSTSMAMRYPVDKTLDKMHKNPIHFDFVNFNGCMVKLYDGLNKIKYELSRQIFNIADEKDIASFITKTRALLPDLKQYLEEVEKDKKNDEDRKCRQLNLLKVIKNYPSNHITYLENASGDLKILAEVLFYCGRTIVSEEITLAKNPVEKSKEFVTICLNQMDRDGLKFRVEPMDNQLNLYSKSSDAISTNIHAALKIIGLEDKNESYPDKTKNASYHQVLVAIRCATYNHEPYIRDALEGFVMQKTNFPFVAIVHDDASTDGTAAIIREYADKYPNIIIPIYETENQYSKKDGSLSRIMNRACEKTGAKYIALCEGDDYWTDANKLQLQVDFLESHPDYSMCFHEAHIKNETSNTFEYPKLENKEYNSQEIFRNWIIPTASMMFIKSILSSVPKDERFISGDIVLALSCAKLGKVYGFNKPMSMYRVQYMGVTLARLRNPLQHYKNEINHYVALYNHFPIIGKNNISEKLCDSYINYGVAKLKSGNIFGLYEIIKGFIYSPKRLYIRVKGKIYK